MIERLVALGAIAVGGIALGRAADAWPATGQRDAEILSFLAVVEAAQARLYEEAETRGALSAELLEFAATAGEHERAHLEWIRSTAGAELKEPPQFSFGAAAADDRAFLRIAVDLEELAVGAFNGNAPNLRAGLIQPTAEIASVEGRHAGWVRDIAARPPAPRAADPGMAAAAVSRRLERYAGGSG